MYAFDKFLIPRIIKYQYKFYKLLEIFLTKYVEIIYKSYA